MTNLQFIKLKVTITSNTKSIHLQYVTSKFIMSNMPLNIWNTVIMFTICLDILEKDYRNYNNKSKHLFLNKTLPTVV